MSLITLPGLVDVHVHFRDPGQTHKEDFYTGTSAALAGGYTTIFDMPNNAEPITTEARLEAKLASARKQIVCDLGVHFGSLGENLKVLPKIVNRVGGLKIYMNVTTGNFKIDAPRLLQIYKAWPNHKPIMLHAEDDVSSIVMKTVSAEPQHVHMCHVSSEAELSFVMKAKAKGLPITCGVTPHHLFLTEQDAQKLGPFGHMKPYLKTAKDVKFLWDHLDAVDVIETDHAPHTLQEKASSVAPFGVPGLETALPLMLTAEAEGKLTRQQLINLMHVNPSLLFGVRADPGTKVEVELGDFVIDNKQLLTKCGWSPFDGRHVAGKVKTVYIRGQKVYDQGKVLAKPGSGKIISKNYH